MEKQEVNLQSSKTRKLWGFLFCISAGLNLKTEGETKKKKTLVGAMEPTKTLSQAHTL